MFNNAAYAGISSPIWGTFTYGRQSALTSDAVVNYDPMGNSNAFSVIGFQGATGGGGDTQNRIYDNSFEYRVNVGPVRLAVETQLRNGGNSGTGNAFEGDVGFDYLGFSFDALGSKIDDAISASTPERHAGHDDQRGRSSSRARTDQRNGVRQHRLHAGCQIHHRAVQGVRRL